MKYIAMYINCMRGKFIPYGPFDAEAQAWSWVNKQVGDANDYSVFKIETP